MVCVKCPNNGSADVVVLGFDKRDGLPTECNQQHSIRQFPGHFRYSLGTSRVIGPVYQEKNTYRVRPLLLERKIVLSPPRHLVAPDKA